MLDTEAIKELQLMRRTRQELLILPLLFWGSFCLII